MLTVTLTDTFDNDGATVVLNVQTARITRNTLILEGLAGSSVPADNVHAGIERAFEIQRIAHEVHADAGRMQFPLPDFGVDIA